MEKYLCFMLVFMVAVVSDSAGEINITGTVVNQSEFPVSGLSVSLASGVSEDSTDSTGSFELYGETGVENVREKGIKEGRPFFAEKGCIVVNPGRVRFDIYSLNGAHVTTLLSKGLRNQKRIMLSDALPEGSASGSYIGRLQHENKGYSFKLIKVARGDVIISNLKTSALREVSSTGSIQESTKDTLIIMRDGEEEFRVPLDTLSAELYVRLDLIPYSVVDIAVYETDRYPDEVGSDMDHYPYALVNYLDKTGDGEHEYEAWCSEFVAWAYRASTDYSLGSGNDDWMVGWSTGLRTWFRENADFIDRESENWDTFVPSPGDYVRYDNEWGGHSGIVRYASGDTLYTAEGNVNNKVYIRAIPDWKNYTASGDTRIDGIGMRSGYLSEEDMGIISLVP